MPLAYNQSALNEIIYNTQQNVRVREGEARV